MLGHLRRFLWAAPFVLTGTLLCLTVVGLPVGIILIEIGMRPIVRYLHKRSDAVMEESHRQGRILLVPPLSVSELRDTERHPDNFIPLDRSARARLEYNTDVQYVDWNNDFPPDPPKPWEEDEG
jgi:hypothetical protein